MPMTHVDLSLWDIDSGHLRDLEPRIIFWLDKPGTKPGGETFTTREIVFTPDADGEVSAYLTTTVDFGSDNYYHMRIIWQNPAGPDGRKSYTAIDYPDWKIRVPLGGGKLIDMVGEVTNPRVVAVSLAEPTPLSVGMFWLEQNPENPYDPLNTGRLYEARRTMAGLEFMFLADLTGPAGPAGQPMVQKSVAVQLSTGVDGYLENNSAQNVRYPFKLAAGTKRARLHIANYNDANDTANVVPNLVLNKNVFVGRHRIAGDGSLTGEFVAAPHMLTDFPTGNLPIPSSTEVVTNWMDVDIQSGIEYLLSLSYYNPDGGQIASGMGFTWRSSATGNVDVVGPVSGQVETIKCPFTVWIEIEVPDEVPVVAHIGDSLLVGRDSAYTLHDSYANKHAGLQGCVPRIHGIAGSRMTDWIATPSAPKLTRFANIPAADAAVVQIGSNDLYDFSSNPSAAVSEMKSRLADLIPLVRANLSPNIYLATILPRNVGASNPEINAVRHQYNEYLMTLPHGALGCFDFATAVADRSNPDLVASYLVASDGVHLLSGGYTRMAQEIPGPLAGPTIT